MAHPLKHAESSAKKFGGKAEDYLPIHNWFDESKAILADFRHRALRHHSEGIFLAEKLLAWPSSNSDGKRVPVRYLGEQHVREDLAAFPQLKIGCCRSSQNVGCTANRETSANKELQHVRPKMQPMLVTSSAEGEKSSALA